MKGQGDVKELGSKPITLYVLIAPIHLNVDQLNLDLKIQDVWVEFNLVGHNLHLRCRSFRTKRIQKQLHVLHLAFHNCFEFKRIPLKNNLLPVSRAVLPHPSLHHTHHPSPCRYPKRKSVMKAFSLTPRLGLENWLVTHTLLC